MEKGHEEHEEQHQKHRSALRALKKDFLGCKRRVMMDQGPGHCSTLTPNLLQFFTIKKNDGEEFAKIGVQLCGTKQMIRPMQ